MPILTFRFLPSLCSTVRDQSRKAIALTSLFVPGVSLVRCDRSELAVLVTSREGMTRGALLSHGGLEQLLAQLQNLLPQAMLQDRLDRDGPVEHPAGMR